ncbi:MAG: ATP-binding protein [Limnohabitans sp.]
MLRSAWLALALLGLLWAVLLRDMQNTLEREIDKSHRDLASTVDISAQSLNASLRVLDSTLQELRYQWQRAPEAFPAAVSRWQQSLGAGNTFYAGVVGADGRILYSSVDPAAKGRDASQRETYRTFAYRAKVEDKFLLSLPIRSMMAEDQWWIPVTRPLMGPSGEFQGVISILISPAYFTGLYQPVALGPSGLITLVRADGQLLLRSVSSQWQSTQLQTTMPVPQVREDMLDFLESAQARRSGRISVAVSPVDGLERAYVWRKVEDYPLTLIIGELPESLYRELSTYRVRYIATGVVLSGLILFFSFARYRLNWLRENTRRRQAMQIRKLQRSSAKLHASRNALRALHGRELMARESERQLIAQEIHDELGQRLTLVRMEVAMLARVLQSEGPARLDECIQDIKASLLDALSLVRNISTQLRPALIDVSLHAALEAQLQELRSKTDIHYRIDNQMPEHGYLDDDVATAAFRIVQEALTNVVRHAQASEVVVTLRLHEDQLLLDVQDNGIGWPANALSQERRLGLSGMRERARVLGGYVSVSSTPGKGTTVSAVLPLKPYYRLPILSTNA